MAKPNFVVADTEISQSLGVPIIVVLANIEFWNHNYEALQAWCEQHHSEVQGMTVNIPDDTTLTAFCLRWA